MNVSTTSHHQLGDRLIASGVHLDLSNALRHHIVLKAGRLLRHQPRIDRIRVDVIHDATRGPAAPFTARGRIEIGGPDLVAAATGIDAYAAINRLTERLDRALRKRATAYARRQRTPNVASAA